MMETMTFLDRKPGLYLKETGFRSRGVFCVTAIIAGEELETTPAIILNEKENRHTDETILREYVFKIGKLSKEIRHQANVKVAKDSSCVVMGMASFCNHDEQPNAEVVWEEQDGTLYYVLRATKDIPADTEICTSYGENWFENRDIELK